MSNNLIYGGHAYSGLTNDYGGEKRYSVTKDYTRRAGSLAPTTSYGSNRETNININILTNGDYSSHSSKTFNFSALPPRPGHSSTYSSFSSTRPTSDAHFSVSSSASSHQGSSPYTTVIRKSSTSSSSGADPYGGLGGGGYKTSFKRSVSQISTKRRF